MSDSQREDELEALRMEVRRLRELAVPRKRWKSILAAILVMIGCGLAPAAVLAVWSASQVWVVDEAATAIDQKGLPDGIGARLIRLKAFVQDKAPRLANSGTLHGIWIDVDKLAHKGLSTMLSAERGDMAYSSWLDRLKFVLPVTSAALVATGILLARSRRRAIVGAGLSLTAGMLMLAAGLAACRHVFMVSVAAHGLDTVAAGELFDTLVSTLEIHLYTLLALGLVTAAVIFVTPRKRAIADELRT